MRPLFTVHAGEFLVGDHISRKLRPRFDVWLPVQDTGVDLLVTPNGRRGAPARPVKLQVKFSRSFPAKFDEPELRARGWFTLKPTKILSSRADVWVFVILTLRQKPYFVLVPLGDLKRRMPNPSAGVWHLDLSIYGQGRCYDTRGLRRQEVLACPAVGVGDRRLDYTAHLENWSLLTRPNLSAIPARA